jgi:integrase
MIFIAMLFGLRPSEILGLRWDDVDFAAGILHVRRSLSASSRTTRRQTIRRRRYPSTMTSGSS